MKMRRPTIIKSEIPAGMERLKQNISHILIEKLAEVDNTVMEKFIEAKRNFQ